MMYHDAVNHGRYGVDREVRKTERPGTLLLPSSNKRYVLGCTSIRLEYHIKMRFAMMHLQYVAITISLHLHDEGW